jgi:hypothetical protein
MEKTGLFSWNRKPSQLTQRTRKDMEPMAQFEEDSIARRLVRAKARFLFTKGAHDSTLQILDFLSRRADTLKAEMEEIREEIAGLEADGPPDAA